MGNDQGIKFIDDALKKVTYAMDLGLDRKQRDLKIETILETRDNDQNSLFDLIKQQASPKYTLLLGFCFMFGIGTSKDQREALRNWEEDGTTYGLYMAGKCYSEGVEGVNINHEKAFSYFQISANAGNTCGQNALGVCYEEGEGCHKDLIAAYNLYHKSSEAGNSNGQCNLGVCYEYGKGVEIDLEKAVYWYRKSTEAGNSQGQWHLGGCYEYGKGVEIDLEKAVYWYQKSAEAGNSDGQRKLATCYEYGKGVEISLEKAVHWYQKSADAGNSLGQWWLGNCYEYGKGVKVSLEKAVRLYQNSAETGNAVGQWWFGKGKGVEKAVHWYQEFDEADNSVRQWWLGNGKGVMDLEKTAHWFQKSAKAASYFCPVCTKKQFNENFQTRRNEKADTVIKSSPVNASGFKKAIEFTPPQRFHNIERIGGDGFKPGFKASLLDCCGMKSWNIEKRIWNRFQDVNLVALKYCDNWGIFMNELKAVGNYLNFATSPFSLRCYSVTYNDVIKRYTLVLAFAKKGGLRNYLRRSYGQLTWQTKFDALTGNLSLIQQASLLPTDLQPCKILVDNNVKSTSSSNDNQHMWETMPYITPKILDVQPYTPADIDRCSFAMIMWEPTFGKPPFGKETEGKRSEIEDETSDYYAEFIEKCWNYNPDTRPTSHELIDVFRFLADSKSESGKRFVVEETKSKVL